jgi:hypothetical protein
MKKRLVLWGILLFMAVSFVTPRNGYATSWKKLSANEVISSAEVIVQGSYDQYGFNQYDLVGGLWVPFKFRVERYYKGTGTTIIDAAIPHLDIGWVKEFQENNGSFILFLKRDSQNAELLIPVGGPNGMVQLMKGIIQNQSPEELATYEKYIESQVLEPVIPSISQDHKEVTEPQSVSQDYKELSKKINWYWIVSALVLALGGLLAFYRVLVRRRNP